MNNTFGVPGVTGQEEYENAEKALTKERHIKRHKPSTTDVGSEVDGESKSKSCEDQV